MMPLRVHLTLQQIFFFIWGAQIRRNSTISIFNSIIMGFPNGLYIDATKGVPKDNNIPSSLFVQKNIIAGCTQPVLYSIGANTNVALNTNTTTTITNWYNTPSYGNTILTNNTEVGLIAPFDYLNPDFNPAAASVAIGGASFNNPKLTSGFTQVDYKGACAIGDTWWKGWTLL